MKRGNINKLEKVDKNDKDFLNISVKENNKILTEFTGLKDVGILMPKRKKHNNIVNKKDNDVINFDTRSLFDNIFLFDSVDAITNNYTPIFINVNHNSDTIYLDAENNPNYIKIEISTNCPIEDNKDNTKQKEDSKNNNINLVEKINNNTIQEEESKKMDVISLSSSEDNLNNDIITEHNNNDMSLEPLNNNNNNAALNVIQNNINNGQNNIMPFDGENFLNIEAPNANVPNIIHGNSIKNVISLESSNSALEVIPLSSSSSQNNASCIFSDEENN